MANNRCFSNDTDKIDSSIYTSRKKDRTIYRASRDLANNNGVYHKNTRTDQTGQNKGTYVGDIYVSHDGTKCLTGANSYDSLLSVTKGKYLDNPRGTDLYNDAELYLG